MIVKRGFTLIELMVVVLIILLLAGVIVVNVDQARKKARDQARIADLNNVASALEAYHADTQQYPAGDLIAGAGTMGEAGSYPLSKCAYVYAVKVFLKDSNYLNSCPQEASLNFANCTQFGSGVEAACTSGGIPQNTIKYNNPNYEGYRYTCWSTNTPYVCEHYALATFLEENSIPPATIASDINNNKPSYRICDGEPDYGSSWCLNH